MVILRWLAATTLTWCASVGYVHAGTGTSQDAGTIRVFVAAPLRSGQASATLTLTHEGATARVRDVAASHTPGIESFVTLQPGTFVLSITTSGGNISSLTVQLGLREIVTVRAEITTGNPGVRLVVVDRMYVGEGANFDERWLADLPSANDVWSLIETTAPDVIVDRMDTGGLGLGRSAMMGSRGASWTSTSVTFGGISLLSPNRTGLMAIAPDMNTVRAVSAASGMAPIETDTPGVVVALTPERPGRARRAGVQASFTEPRMVVVPPASTSPPIARISTWRNASAQLSGPLGPRTSLLMAVAAARAQFFERNLPMLWTSDSASVLGHVMSQLSDDDQLRVITSAQRVTTPFEQRRQFLDRSATERGAFVQASATWEHMSGQTLTSLSGSFQRGSFTPRFATAAGGTVDRYWDGAVPPPVAATVSSEWTLKAQIMPRSIAWGPSRHELRFGANVSRANAVTDVLALPVVAEQVASIAARVWMPGAPAAASHRTRLSGAVHVADRITLGSSFSIEAGVRADVADGSADGATEGISWRTASPRGSFRWQRGPFALYGGAGLYRDPLLLSRLSYGDPGEAVSDVYRWHDADNDRQYDAGERGVLVRRAGWGAGIASIDPDLQAPRTFERTLGIELRYKQALTFRGKVIYRDQTALAASVNTGVPASSYRVLYVPDRFEDWDGPDDDQPLAIYDRLPASFGKDAFLLTNPAGEKATYEGLEFTWILNTRRLLTLFGVTAHRTRSWSASPGFGPFENEIGIIGERLEQPNASPVLQGSYIFDRSYVGKLSTSYRAPGDIRLGFSARYQDGQPFSRVVVVPDLAGGAEMVHAYRTGRTRFTYTLTLDVRLAKDFSIGGHRSSVQLDVFNATRFRNEVEEDVLTTPAFRRTTAVQPPLAVRVGFRVSF